jgi:hypothetical protein
MAEKAGRMGMLEMALNIPQRSASGGQPLLGPKRGSQSRSMFMEGLAKFEKAKFPGYALRKVTDRYQLQTARYNLGKLAGPGWKVDPKLVRAGRHIEI